MKTAFIHGIILDGSKDMVPVKNKMIIVEDGKIIDIRKEEPLPANYKIVDLNNQYIMPGLINLHVHLPSSGKPTKKEVDHAKLVKLVTSNAITRKIALKLCETSARTQLYSGVTTIRTMGGILNIDSVLREKIKKNEIIGPEILASNMAISVEGGHMAHSLAYVAKDEEHAKELVRKIASDNVDVLKLMITGGVLDAKKIGEPGELKMKPEIVHAACAEAHRLGLKVAAHVESPEGVKVALENGVDTIEHGAKPDEEIIELFKQHKAVHVATISPALPFALFDPTVSNASEMAQENGKIVFNGIIECAIKCLENDIPVGLGTDTGCPYITHYDMWREIHYFHRYCHVSPSFALYTATRKNAEIAGISHLCGSIEIGKCADMIVCKDNPLEDLTVLRNLSMIIKNGNVLNSVKIKKMQNVEKELDKFI